MSIITEIMNRLRPSVVSKTIDSSPIAGYGSADGMIYGEFDKLSRIIDQGSRLDIMEQVREMALEGAIADKALDKLCEDATSSEINIDAPPRRKKIISELLTRIGYPDVRKSLLYIMLRDGDLFVQLAYEPFVIDTSKIGRISKIMVMPSETMIRNSNEQDEFDDINRSFAQVDTIVNGLYGEPKTWFPWVKIIHARNDPHKGKFFRYGWSMWASGIKIYNMAMMLLEDSAIMRHLATQKIRVHYIGRESQAGVDATLIKDYQKNIMAQMNQSTTDLFIDGRNVVEDIGGTRNVVGSVDDVMMALSILAIAVEYPIDLLSGMINRGSGGEELFRKETVLKRTVESIIKKENQQILKPMIDRELMLAGAFGEYRITTYPVTFEDQNKRSKRGLGEVSSLLKSPRTFHEENNDEIGWDKELVYLEEDLKKIEELAERYPTAISILSKSTGRKDPQAGNSGESKEVDDQQDRSTPGKYGTEDRSEG